MSYDIADVIISAQKGAVLSQESNTKIGVFKIRTGRSKKSSIEDIEKIKGAFDSIERLLEAHLEIIGGGKGCTEFIVKISKKNGGRLADIMSEIADSAEIISKLKAAGFRVIFDVELGVQYSLDDLEKSKLQSENITTATAENDLSKFGKDGRVNPNFRL